MKKKIFITSFVAVITLTVAISGFMQLNKEEGYLQPKSQVAIGEKNVGSDKLNFTRMNPPVANMVKDCDLIVTGEITSDLIETKSFEIMQADDELRDKFKSLYPNAETPKQYGQYFNFKVDEVFKGNLSGDMFTFSKLAEQTNFAKGEKVLMFLVKDTGAEDRNTYCSIGLEDGIFKIDNNDNLTSLSNSVFTSAYDGYKKERLVKDIKKALKDNTIKPLTVKVESSK
jgi:hypothetical protein